MSCTGLRSFREPALPRCAAALACALALAAMAAIGAAAAETTGPPSPPPLPPPPSAPAFYTFSMSRIRNIQGDSFDFERDNGKRLRVRLAWADCAGVSDRLRGHAETIARDILEAAPVWVLPCGRPKGVADEVWACVWTDKGWLSEILVRAGYATRRVPPDAASLEPFDPAGTTSKAPPPAAPAFASATCKVVQGDMFEVSQGTRVQPVRLFDVTCTGAGEPPHDAAKAAAQQCLGESSVWVFPSSPPKPGEDLRVRLWTPKGWLSQALLDQKLAVAYADPLKPDSETADPKPEKTADPAKTAGKTAPKTKTDDSAGTWRAIPLTPRVGGTDAAVEASKAGTGMTSMTALSAESEPFKVTSDTWRISWDLKPVREGGHVVLNVQRVDDKWLSRTSSTHVASFKGLRGAQYLRGKPGLYWIRIVGSTDLKVKVEEKVKE